MLNVVIAGRRATAHIVLVAALASCHDRRPTRAPDQQPTETQRPAKG